MLSPHDEAARIVQDWFSDMLRTCGLNQSEVADLLKIPPTEIDLLMAGDQMLRADQMLFLSQVLGRPLPATSPIGTERRTSSHKSFPRELFDKAYEQVMRIEAMKPEYDRLDTVETLDTVFYVLHSMLEPRNGK
ncbi:hypothetical protein [Roseibium sp.]|uniref:hypothetical protein n=1 Tax=Roseibium sp. TaxID=1936156 RepID=UPI003A96B7EB